MPASIHGNMWKHTDIQYIYIYIQYIQMIVAQIPIVAGLVMFIYIYSLSTMSALIKQSNMSTSNPYQSPFDPMESPNKYIHSIPLKSHSIIIFGFKMSTTTPTTHGTLHQASPGLPCGAPTTPLPRRFWRRLRASVACDPADPGRQRRRPG